MYEKVKAYRCGKFSSRGPWLHVERRINEHELIIVTDGEVHIRVGEESLSLSVGDILHIRPGELHGGTRESEGVSFYWIHLTAEESELPPRLIHPASPERILLRAKELLHYQSTSDYPSECQDAAAKLLLAEIAHGSREGEGRLIAEIKDFVRRKEGAPLTTVEVAEAFGYNPDHLNRLFKAKVGAGIKSYIDTVRMDKLKEELMCGSLTLCELAEKYGFSDYKYLLKFFRYHEGISPKKFRDAYYNMYTN